jgi:hypothetical protein
VNADLAEDGLDVVGHGVGRQEEAGGDVIAGQAAQMPAARILTSSPPSLGTSSSTTVTPAGVDRTAHMWILVVRFRPVFSGGYQQSGVPGCFLG